MGRRVRIAIIYSLHDYRNKMIKTTAINVTGNPAFSVIWDTGLRCNLDCTYCSASRHNNYSPHTPLTNFIKTFNFIEQWTDIYNSKRKTPLPTAINFTGGEPTVNPGLWKLASYIKSRPGKFYLGLTTNGVIGKKYLNNVITNFDAVTVSYHAETTKSVKRKIIENIYTLHQAGITVQVNVMLHMDHWDECVAVYDELKANGINCKPRPIGDGAVAQKTWYVDSDGNNRRSDHTYTPAQLEWFWNENGIKNKSTTGAGGGQVGRACCGGTCLEGKVEGTWQPIKLVNTEFKDWHCMVDWYFLYIAQHKNEVYHHQSCKALHGKKIGPIGTLDDTDKIIEDLTMRFSQPTIEHIVCPKTRCACGMCAPKAESLEDFKYIQNSLLKL